MIELSTHIEYLLLEHDDVAIPHLGMFHAESVSAQRIEEEGIFLPPHRTITFRQDDTLTGETFIRSLAKLYSLPLQEAAISCSSYIEELRQTLAEEGTVGVGSIGYFMQDEGSDVIEFAPFQSGVCTPLLYGLDALHMPKLDLGLRQHHEKLEARQKVNVTRVEADKQKITISINRRIFNFAATAAASIAIFFALTTSGDTTYHNEQNASAELFLPAGLVSSIEAVKSAEPVVQAVPVENENIVDHGYFIVLASAISRQNALTLAGDLQQRGYDAHACHVGGMIRVIIPGFSSEEEARDKIRVMRHDSDEFNKAWPSPVKKPFTLTFPE